MDVRLEQIHAPVSPEDVAFLAKGLKGVWEHIGAYADAGLLQALPRRGAQARRLWCFVAVENATGARVGVVTVTRFSMIRYLG